MAINLLIATIVTGFPIKKYIRYKLLRYIIFFMFAANLHSVYATDKNLSDRESLIVFGEKIYTQGSIENSTVHIGRESDPAPAQLFPCINCHGKYAQGKSEGGINTPNLTAFNILKRNYQTKSLTTPSLMPRYSLNRHEIDALAAYIDAINEQIDTGITDKQITLSVILPTNLTSDANSATKAILNAYARNKNKLGGVFQRSIHFEFITRNTPIKKNNSFMTLDINSIQDSASKKDVTFDFASSEQQSKTNNNTIVISIFDDTKNSSFNHGNHFSLYSRDYENIDFYNYAAASFGYTKIENIARCKKNSTGTNGDRTEFISHIGNRDELISNITRLLNNSCTPALFLNKTIVTQKNGEQLRSLLRQYPSPIYLFSTPPPQMVSSDRQQTYLSLKHDSELDRKSLIDQDPSAKKLDLDVLNTQLRALTLMHIIEESLNAAGRQLSRDKVINYISQLRQYETGFGPALTFSANQKIGARGAFMSQLNTQFNPTKTAHDTWIKYAPE